MRILEAAYQILDKLKENNFDGYIVGGAVRDHLLKRPINDIDITTNAKPFEVAKIFTTTKPTGIKYGTVTVIENNFQFEVTTFRKDGPSSNNRHPDMVFYGDSVIDDVNRRDFTINGLLLNRRGEVLDYVGGQKDLKNKIIKTIGNPQDRFREDALRILRAFYFQSKLNFEIDQNTILGIEKEKSLIQNLASERVLVEVLKLLKEDNSLKAFQTMVKTNVHEELPGLTKGIEFIAGQDKKPFNDTFFTLCIKLNKGRINPYWKFSNQHRQRYLSAANLAIKFDNEITDYDLFEAGLSNSLLAINVNEFLGKTTVTREEINFRYENLPIKSELELKISPNEMIDSLGKKAGAWINNYRKRLARLVIERKIENNKETLLNYIMKLEKGVLND